MRPLHQEKSCGTIVFKKEENISNRVKYLLIKHAGGGHWSFPKGHVENNESEYDTAFRETKEETGYEVKFLDGFREVIEYSPKAGIIKKVVFFLGFPYAGKLDSSSDEIETIKWFNYQEALAQITFGNSKNVLKKANSFLLKQNVIS